MEAAGLAPLTIPDNYYDDVGARFRLTLDLSDKLQAHSILSDEDETGRYFQIYTHVFAEQLFFKIVPRDGYQGFGAFNVPIRLAAQERLSRHPSTPRR